MPTNWSLDSVSCTRNGNTVGGTTNISGGVKPTVPIVAGSTTTCTFNNSLSASQLVTFTVTVTNNSLESASLFSLEDSENPTAGTPTYATLNGVGTCSTVSITILNGAPYSCTFTRTVSGPPGTQHKDKVKAVGNDNDSNSDTKESGIVTVTIH